MWKIENQKQNDRFMPKHINNHIKYKWSKHPNQNAETLRLDTKADHTIFYL